jgi:hypothetical protein
MSLLLAGKFGTSQAHDTADPTYPPPHGPAKMVDDRNARVRDYRTTGIFAGPAIYAEKA